MEDILYMLSKMSYTLPFVLVVLFSLPFGGKVFIDLKIIRSKSYDSSPVENYLWVVLNVCVCVCVWLIVGGATYSETCFCLRFSIAMYMSYIYVHVCLHSWAVV